MSLQSVCVFGASSSQIPVCYKEQASLLGEILSKRQIACQYGGGGLGVMGALADSMIRHGGELIGIMPHFMYEEKWFHAELSELILVEDMHERKKRMVADVDAIIAMPGGVGTIEELMEVITWKQLGLLFVPIVIVNINHFYDDLLRMFDKCVSEHFISDQHAKIWIEIDSVDQIVHKIENAPIWHTNARNHAAL